MRFTLIVTAAATQPASYALYHNIHGGDNAASGFYALYKNTTGSYNTANGSAALYSNTTGDFNTAEGRSALYSNTTGFFLTAVGAQALFSNTTGNHNTALGLNALYQNTTGASNVAIGEGSLVNNTTGNSNTALGTIAGSPTTGSGNVCVGTDIFGVAGESNTTRIRNVYSSVASGRAVYVDSDNKIGTLSSSRRYKEEIKPMEEASEVILALRPVSFRYKEEIEPNRAQMFGLIAEEVEQVDPKLVTCNEQGEADTVRYEAINAMLLNEFLKEHRKVQELEATIVDSERELRFSRHR